MFKHKHEGTNEKNPQRFNLLKHWWDFHLTDGLNVSYGYIDIGDVCLGQFTKV